jgi:proteasome accessory factor C
VSRIGANERLQRLLSIVPWVVAHPGATVDEICARFSIPEAVLLKDLDTLRYVGVYPFTPDALIDVVLEDGRVWLHLAEPFGRPLRLTPEEALGLVAAGKSLLAVPGADPEGPLARGLAKLAATLGVEGEDTLEVSLADAVSATTLEILQTGAREHRRVDLEYYSHARDEHTQRTIDPYRVYADQGQWYVVGHCHQAEGERIFRLDRIQAAVLSDERFEPPAELPGRGVFRAGPDDPVVVLDLTPEAAWVTDHYPLQAVEDLEDGRTRVTLAVTARPWLERLLLSLGPDATVVSIDARLGGPEVRAEAAARVLARYGTPEGVR